MTTNWQDESARLLAMGAAWLADLEAHESRSPQVAAFEAQNLDPHMVRGRRWITAMLALTSATQGEEERFDQAGGLLMGLGLSLANLPRPLIALMIEETFWVAFDESEGNPAP